MTPDIQAIEDYANHTNDLRQTPPRLSFWAAVRQMMKGRA